jgi:hypothetical protein
MTPSSRGVRKSKTNQTNQTFETHPVIFLVGQ